MSELSSPILIIGDKCLCNETIVNAKKKYDNFYWETVSATESSCEEIRMISGINQLWESNKIILIKDIPNRKEVRVFLQDLIQMSSDSLKFVLWDSNNAIKVDPKTKKFNKTWGDWINELKKHKDFKLIDLGGDFSEKENVECSDYIIKLFAKYNKQISKNNAHLLSHIVGRNRSMLKSEIEKMCYTCPNLITDEFILKNAYPTAKEAPLYQFDNDLNTGDLSIALNSLETYLNYGINPNVLAEVLMRKSRWHLVACDLFKKGYDYYAIKNKMLSMGKFPSNIWYSSDLTDAQKKNQAIEYGMPDNMADFMTNELGLPSHYFNVQKPKSKPTKTIKKGECIPMPFMADKIVDYMNKNIVNPNRDKFNSNNELKQAVYNRSLNVYIKISDHLKEIRYNNQNSKKELYQMVKIWVDNVC